LNRRQFGLRVAAASAAILGVGAAGTGEWLHAKHKGQLKYAMDPNVAGANSLQAHAAVKGLVYGASVNPLLLDVEGVAEGHTEDGYTQLVMAQTGMLVDEFATYWKWMRPSPDTFKFKNLDRLMGFAELTGKKVRGHVLVWHYAMPGWFGKVATKQNARELLVNHIRTVVGRLKGLIDTWDVVNEAIEPMDGRADGLRKSPWLELIGPDYIELAFRTSAEADPNAKLAYNDYGIETDLPRDAKKRDFVLALLERLKASGTPIHAVGVQSHLFAAAGEPGPGLQSFIRETAKMGLEAHISELDVSFMRMKGGAADRDATVARVYKDYLNLVLAEPNVPLVITWGITDAHTWLRSAVLFMPFSTRRLWARIIVGLRERPLPFDDEFAAKPAFWAMRTAFDEARPRGLAAGLNC
jgi:endo-1,4-beta-xylanase